MHDDDTLVISEETEGSAFLRNGWSHVTAMIMTRFGDRVTVEVVNTKNTITTGYMAVGLKAMLRAATRLLQSDQDPFVIHTGILREQISDVLNATVQGSPLNGGLHNMLGELLDRLENEGSVLVTKQE